MSTPANGAVAASDAGDDKPKGSWREQAVARRLDPARARAEDRVQRFLDAALELMNDTDGSDFTVQEVVQKSGQSLRSFYQYFNGKQELLLALFEESVATTADMLKVLLEEEKTAADRLRRFVVEYYRVCRPARPKKGSKTRPGPAMITFAQQLLTAQPEEAARAFSPLVDLFEETMEQSAREGAVRSDLNGRRIAGVILEAIMFNVFSRTIGGVRGRTGDGDPAEELWDLLLHGIAAS
jgi:AcrR family transcriptional regulator